MIDLGIVIPAYRLPNQEQLQQRIIQSARMDARPGISYEFLFVTADRFDIVTRDGGQDFFNIAKAYNQGVMYFKNSARYIACADIDLLFPPGFLDYAIRKAGVMPHTHRVRLIDPADIHPRSWTEWKKIKPRPGTGAWNCMRFEDYYKIGGFNESMYGWGGIDTDFKQRKNTTFGRDGCWYDMNMALMHVNHPPNMENAPRRPSENMKIANACRKSGVNWLDRYLETAHEVNGDPGGIPYKITGRYIYTFPKREVPSLPEPEPDYMQPAKSLPANPVPLLPPDAPVVFLTVLRSGWISYNQKEFGPYYVAAMASMLERNVTRPYELWCITDLGDSVRAMLGDRVRAFPLEKREFISKYCKLELFRPDIHATAEGRRIITIDLDTIITGNIDDLVSYGGDFAMLQHPRMKHYGMSGMMSFPAESCTYLYSRFANRPQYYKTHYPLYHGRGDQLWINRQLHVLPHIWEEMFPGRIRDFRTIKNGEEPPGGVGIVYFWGKETPYKHINIPWVARQWESGAIDRFCAGGGW